MTSGARSLLSTHSDTNGTPAPPAASIIPKIPLLRFCVESVGTLLDHRLGGLLGLGRVRSRR